MRPVVVKVHELSKTDFNYDIYIHIGFGISTESEDPITHYIIKYNTMSRIVLYSNKLDNDMSKFVDFLLTSPSSQYTDLLRVTEKSYSHGLRDINNPFFNNINLIHLNTICLNLIDSKRFIIRYTG